MNVGEIIDQFRRQTRDVVEEYLWNDDELMIYLNEAQDEAAKRSFLLKTSDMSLGETPSQATITVNGSGSGTISSILVDTQNIIGSPIQYLNNNLATAAAISNEINDQGYFDATVVNNIITLKPAAGGGSQFNKVIPVITQSSSICTATAFSGGIDGICKIQLLPNKRDYTFSNKILRFESFFIGDMIRRPCLRDYRELSDHELANYSNKGSVDSIIYGMSNNGFMVGMTPVKREFIKATVYYKPIKRLVSKSDIPEIPDEFHSKLIDYMIYKAYSKNDAEVDAVDLSSRHLKLFELEFNDNLFTNAFQQKNDLAYFFGDIKTAQIRHDW